VTQVRSRVRTSTHCSDHRRRYPSSPFLPILSHNPNFTFQFSFPLLGKNPLLFLSPESLSQAKNQTPWTQKTAMFSGRFSIFGGGDSHAVDNATSTSKGEGVAPVVSPTLKLETDRQVYRPGDPVVVTIQISNPSKGCSFLMERLGFEIRGIEKLDTQWFATQKPFPGSKQRRGSLVQ